MRGFGDGTEDIYIILVDRFWVICNKHKHNFKNKIKLKYYKNIIRKMVLYIKKNKRLAQMEERSFYTRKVIGSNPIFLTKWVQIDYSSLGHHS